MEISAPLAMPTLARRITVEGRVQGVGFRPFVYRLAHRHGLTGWVLNGAGRVEIQVEGEPTALERFAADLLTEAPPLARPSLADNVPCEPRGLPAFHIESSREGGRPEIHVPPDQFLCQDCRAEIHDPDRRRHAYPFTNCTQCGPRYTLIRSMPYDRPNTTMAGFELCPECRSEFEDPLDRRFHAQPLACARCGPHLEWAGADGTTAGGDAEVIDRCVRALGDGMVVAVRGVGGYHLLCDPFDDAAVARLRERKHRPHRPLALMVPQQGGDGLDAVRRMARPTAEQARALRDPARPIVLVPLRQDARLAAGIAPGLREIGLMLPYSPLHDLLLGAWGGPLVATSGNVSGEPVLTDPEEAARRLAPVADAFVHHDRPIERPADDSVLRQIAGRARPLRLGRGTAPLELGLPVRLARPMLATGGFYKNTVALAWDQRIVISPHIGDLDSPRARALFARTVADLQRLYGVKAEALVCDAHPDYPNARWARDEGRPVMAIQHHAAHAAAVHGEFRPDGPMLCFTWDGTGFGSDGRIWGGELLLGRPGGWRRVGSLRPFRLPGGDRASRQGWRVALALAWEDGFHWPAGEARAPALLREAWSRGINAPWTSSAGRLFDAAAALCGLVMESSHEAHAASWLEAACVSPETADAVVLPRREIDGVECLDWAPLLELMTDDDLAVAERADRFHASLAAAMTAQAVRAAEDSGVRRVGLAGGVFQNQVLTERLVAGLCGAGLEPLVPEVVPCNDAGIAFGQIVEAAAREIRRP